MNHQSFNNLVQLLTSIAVLIGLALVIYELNQTKTLVMTQMISDGFTTGINTELT